MSRLLLALVLSLLILPSFAFAHSTGIAHEEPAFASISLIAAFMGGLLMFFAPCSFSVVPAYFAYAFKNKGKLLVATFVFFLGFAIMFSLFGLSAGYVGYYLNTYKFSIAFYSGIALIIVGALLLLGKALPMPKIRWTPKKTFTGDFLFGIVYAFGYAGCAGPILVGVLLLAVSQSPIISALTMFSYSLGTGIPLMIISYFFDRFKVFNAKLLGKNVIKYKGRPFLSITNLISGVLFIVIGVVFVQFQSLGILDFANNTLTNFSYSLQRYVMQSVVPFGNLLFFVVLVIITLFILKKSGYYFKQGGRNVRKKKR